MIDLNTGVRITNCDVFPDRPWNPGDSPKTALWEYLTIRSEFEVD